MTDTLSYVKCDQENAFRYISILEKDLKEQRLSVKNSITTFSRDKILNEKCSNLSNFSKTIYHMVIGLRYRQSFYKRQTRN